MNPSLKLKKMIAQQIKSRGIKDENVIQAFMKVPRHFFVPENLVSLAYSDRPLPIGEGQTISQPYMVALMTELLDLKDKDKVLEIGTGSGYQTAILAELAREVYTIERIATLLEKAIQILEKLKYKNIHFKLDDGSRGWIDFAPYDKIIVTAGSPDIPCVLLQQLKDGGRMVIPVGSRYNQDLKVVFKKGKNIEIKDAGGCIFVPLVGEFGWEGENK